MKKILCFAVIALLMPIDTVFAAWSLSNFKMGDDKACFVDTYDKDGFWFCGNQRTYCRRDARSGHKRAWLYANEVLDLDKLTSVKPDLEEFRSEDYGVLNKYICCDGSTEKKGTFKENKNTTKDKTLDGGGTCKQIYNACGTLIKDCFTAGDGLCADHTDDGRTLWRNNECVKEECDAGKAWESATSNTCITCTATTYPGRGPDSSGICITCDTNTQYYNVDEERCANIEEVSTRYTAAQLKRCWPCANDNVKLLSCVTGGANATTPDSCLTDDDDNDND